MFPRLRTIALLMLLAGLSLGIFTVPRAARRRRGRRAAAHGRPARRASSCCVDLYQRDYHLDDEQADRVRQELYRYDRAVNAKIWELRQRHADEFQDLLRTTRRTGSSPSSRRPEERPKLGGDRTDSLVQEGPPAGRPERATIHGDPL